MAVVTITRGLLTLTREIAEAVAAKLQARLVSREEVINHGARYGLDRFELSRLGILHRRPPAIWDRYAADRREFLILYRRALMDLVVEGDVVYYGNMGQLILADLPGLLRARLDAPADFRIKRLAWETEITPDKARRRLREFDERRCEWIKFLFRLDYYRHAGYDIILNVATLSTVTIVDLVSCMLDLEEFAPNEASRKAVRSTHLEASIRAELINSPRTRGMQLQLVCDADTGRVEVSGAEPMVGTGIWRRDIEAVIQTLPDVSEVVFL